MEKHFQKLLNDFKKLNLPDRQYAVYGSGPLAVRDIRKAGDLDIVVLDNLYQKLKNKYPKDPEKEKIKIGEIEIYPFWAWDNINGVEEMIKRAEMIGDFRFILLDDLIYCKEKMGREKDFRDIELIKEFLNK